MSYDGGVYEVIVNIDFKVFLQDRQLGFGNDYGDVLYDMLNMII